MPNQTCRFLSNGYKFQITDNNKLRLMPCCKWLGLAEENPQNFQQYRTMLNQVNALTDKRCMDCAYQEEKKLRTSWRQMSFDYVPHDAVADGAYYLEIQLDRTCNGGCIMCGPWLSTFWQKELYNKVTPIKKTSRENHINSIMSSIDVSHAKQIRFLGGEPLLSNSDLQLLSLVNTPEIVDLVYTTNGSIYPSDMRIKLWKKFQSVRINFSVDGIGSRFNYIRYPLQWDIVIENMYKMRDQLPDNIKFSINHTVNIFNLFYFDEFDQWRSKNFLYDRAGKEISYNFSPASGILNPQLVSRSLLALLTEKYHKDSKVINTILSDSLNPQELMAFISQLDHRRKLDWRTVFPDIRHCFDV